MAWIEITEADLLTVLSGPELSSYRSAALASGQADPVAPTVAQVVALARGHVAGCRANTLGAGCTLPEKLKAPALDVIAYRIPSRVNIKAGVARRELHDQALRLFEQVSQGRFDIEEPAVAAAESSGASVPRMIERTRRYTRETEEGI
jgi:hypothetical protein